jgi:hypothetical protein
MPAEPGILTSFAVEYQTYLGKARAFPHHFPAQKRRGKAYAEWLRKLPADQKLNFRILISGWDSSPN